jgi:predicted DsbA family dithiol-disulfide isomerase
MTAALTLYSDFICPYCYLGEQAARAPIEALGLTLEWRGHELHPEIPPPGIPLDALRGAGIDRLWTRIVTLASDLEVPIRRPAILSSSRLALEGSEFARREGRLEDYRERVFGAYFREGRNIGDPETLVDLAVAAGLDGSSFRQEVVGRTFREAIDANREAAEDLLVTGVPTFFLHGVPVLGALSPDEYARQFSRILHRRADRS